MQSNELANQIAEYIDNLKVNKTEKDFEVLYETSKRYVYYTVIRNGVPEHDADDVVQETYIKVLNNVDKLENSQAGMAWIKQIAFHCAMDYHRHHNKETTGMEDVASENDLSLDDSELDTIPVPENVYDSFELQQMLNKMISELPNSQSKVLRAFYFNECSVTEIAQDYEMSEGNVKILLYRGRKSLKDSLLEMEKKQGIKLHSVAIAPFLLFLFSTEADAAEVSNVLKPEMAKEIYKVSSIKTSNMADATLVGTKAVGTVTGIKIAATVAVIAVVGGVAGKQIVDAGNENAEIETEITTETENIAAVQETTEYIAETETESELETVSESIETKESETENVEIENAQYKRAYIDFINELSARNSECKYQLVFIDDDEVPELIADVAWYYLGIYKYDVESASVVGIKESPYSSYETDFPFGYGTWGRLYYCLPKENLIVSTPYEQDDESYTEYLEQYYIDSSNCLTYTGQYSSKTYTDTELVEYMKNGEMINEAEFDEFANHYNSEAIELSNAQYSPQEIINELEK